MASLLRAPKWAIRRGSVFAGLAILLSACVTTPLPPDPSSDPDLQSPSGPIAEGLPGDVVIAEPVITPPPAPDPGPPPPPPSPAPEPGDGPSAEPDIPVYQIPDVFDSLRGWDAASLDPAMAAFQRSCLTFQKADPNAMLNPALPEYGYYRDWLPACAVAQMGVEARSFFEAYFAPLHLSRADAARGLMTGYYEPEVQVRLAPNAEFSDPILALPKSKTVQALPRAQLGPKSARVIAYGRPLDVFFLQVQGSGRLKYADGRTLRAAYAGNNGRPYQSIGRVLIARGELTKDQSAKRDIEAWMIRNGPTAARALMNENPRYIFFTEQRIEAGEGPRGAMRVPLTGMGSMAVDPRRLPYGVPVLVETRLPQRARDYVGTPSSLVLVAQDTGNAIRGPLRGDLFFGSGAAAGALAGVMKHEADWTVLVPRALAETPAPIN